MKIADQILEWLRDQYDSGMTQFEISKKTGIHQSDLCNILSGKKEIGGMRLDTIQNIFPHATLNIDGSPSVKGFGNVVGNNNSDIAINASNVLDHLNAIRDLIVENEKLSADAKVEVLKIIKASLTK